MTKNIHARTLLIVTLVGAALLSGCDQQHSVHQGPPAGTVAADRQPMPQKPLFANPVIATHDVIPHGRSKPYDPLPAAVPLPGASSAMAETAGK